MNREEVILQTDDVRVRVLVLQPGEMAPLHHHSEITDHMFGLTGEIRVAMKNPEETVILTPGARCTVAPGRVHQVSNPLKDAASQYLLVQGIGRYDFIKELADPS